MTNGTWTADLGKALAIGNYVLTATQTVNGVTSGVTTIDFGVVAASSGPIEASELEENAGGLANSGTQQVLPFALSAVSLLLMSGATSLLLARRQKNA